MGGDRGDAQVPDGIPISGGATDLRNDGEMQGRRIVGLPIGRGGNGRHGYPPYWGVHQEAADDHSGEGGLLPYICTTHRGGADTGDKPFGAIAGSRCSK